MPNLKNKGKQPTKKKKSHKFIKKENLCLVKNKKLKKKFTKKGQCMVNVYHAKKK